MAVIVQNKSLIGVAFLSIFLFFASGSIELSACPNEYPLDCGDWCCPDQGFENCEEIISAGGCIEDDNDGNVCPSTYPVDCGNDYCCTTIEWCPEEGELISYECIQKEVDNDDGGVCPSAYLLGERDPRIDVLRQYRDEVLSQSPVGKEIIELYYQFSPFIVMVMKEDESFKEDVKGMIDGVLGLVEEETE